jgi:hypothetical protein
VRGERMHVSSRDTRRTADVRVRAVGVLTIARRDRQ